MFLIFSPYQGAKGAAAAPQRGTFFSAPLRRAIRMRQCCVDRFQDIFHFGVYLLIPEPHHSVTVCAQISRSQTILTLLLPLSMLTAVEFDNQSLRDAAEIGEVQTDAVLSAEFESAEALGSEVLPQPPLFIRRPATKSWAAIARSFVLGIHNRAP
jgi:hypothetical protein